MGRPIKLSDRKREWFLKRLPCRERRLGTREERQRFLIVCEGEKTEPNYFESFKQDLPRQVVQLEIFGEGANTLSLVARARALRDNRASGDYPFDEVWVVFDRDSFDPSSFDNAIHSADSCGMHCAWSNEAFELWYILHFEFRNTEMSRTEYQGKLGEFLGEIYRKNAPDMYQKLSQIGKQSQAAAWAKTLHDQFLTDDTPPSRSNPCTTVYLLVEKLNQFKPSAED
ncbi:MAG: RloB family protein [Deltaproteobacteria bacterium]|nr:RloB family protein [Deltaproteobacteria bacterium]